MSIDSVLPQASAYRQAQPVSGPAADVPSSSTSHFEIALPADSVAVRSNATQPARTRLADRHAQYLHRDSALEDGRRLPTNAAADIHVHPPVILGAPQEIPYGERPHIVRYRWLYLTGVLGSIALIVVPFTVRYTRVDAPILAPAPAPLGFVRR